MNGAPLGILLMSGTLERAHYAFVLAAGAAAIGRKVLVFATNAGCGAMLEPPVLADPDEFAARLAGSGVADFATLREAAISLGARLVACSAGLAVSGIPLTTLPPHVEAAGVATLLTETAGGQIVTL